MVQKCIVLGCGSKWYPGCSLIFHSFPKDPSRRKQWLSSVKLKNQFYETAKICSNHFEPVDYIMENRLKHTAVPSFSVMSRKSELEGNACTVSVYNTPVKHETIFPLPSTSHCELADNLAVPEESLPTSKAYSILTPTAPAKIDLIGNIASNATEGDKVDLPLKKKICLREILVEKNEIGDENIAPHKPSNTKTTPLYVEKSVQVSLITKREEVLKKRNKYLAQKCVRHQHFSPLLTQMFNHPVPESIICSELQETILQKKNYRVIF